MRDRYVLSASCILFLILINNNSVRYYNPYLTYDTIEAQKVVLPRSHNKKQRGHLNPRSILFLFPLYLCYLIQHLPTKQEN